MAKYDAIIIGCGMSGLAAARQLGPFKVAILEARNRLGGRICTADSATGLKEPVDLGGSMVHGYREGNPVARLITAELGMEVHVPEGAKGLVYGPEGPLAEAEATSLFATSAQNSFVPQPGTSPSTSVADLLLPKLAHDPRLVALARTAEIGAGVALEEQSAKFAGFEQGFKGTDGFPVGGYGEVIANLASDVKASGGEIHLDTVVTSIEDVEEQEGACVKVTAENGQTFTARAVISTIPHAVLQQNPPKFSPPLPTSFTSALARIRTGALEKIVLSYLSAWWPSPDQTGSFLLLPLEPTTGDNNNKSDSLEALFASTVIPVTSFERIGMNPHPTLLAYIGASAAKVLARYSTDEVADAFHAYLVKRLGGAETSSSSQIPPAPSTKLVTTWLSDPFSLGATSAPVTLPSSSTTDGGEFSTPLDYILVSRPAWQGRVGFAGEHTDLDNHGSVAGAFISGKREGLRVKELLERLAA
ncbi:FAD/NAD(P)-binding domain-containing protein [Rhodotorula sp. JG-1b]|nr:FAD/NAD(P)-binding domain-containing protein [Rhodotorula sp. JG-1b]